MKSNNSPFEQQRLKKQASPPIKIGKTKTSFGKNSFREKLGGGEKKNTNQTQKIKLRIHMEKNIISFNKCKHDTM